jgi:hypothetical protein
MQAATQADAPSKAFVALSGPNLFPLCKTAGTDPQLFQAPKERQTTTQKTMIFSLAGQSGQYPGSAT